MINVIKLQMSVIMRFVLPFTKVLKMSRLYQEQDQDQQVFLQGQDQDKLSCLR